MTVQYDPNAIRVDNVFGIQVGHIPRTVAAKLSPYLVSEAIVTLPAYQLLTTPKDCNEITLETKLVGDKGFYDVPVRVYIYGTSDLLGRQALEERLKIDKLLKANEMKKTRAENISRRQALGLKSGRGSVGLGVAPEPELSLEQLTQISQAVQFRVGDDIVKTLALDEDQLSKMPMAEQPASLRATLLPYQLQVTDHISHRLTFPP